MDTAEQDHCPYIHGNCSSWSSAAEPICTHVSLKPALKALEFLAPGNATARAEITALTEITGGSWKCYLRQEWSMWRTVEECVNECVRVLAMRENKRFFSGNVHRGASCWKLQPELCYLTVFKVSCVVPAQAWGGWWPLWSTVTLRSHNANNMFVCDSWSERLTGSKCRSFIACLFWLRIAGKGGNGGATTVMGPWTFCSLFSPRLRCSVLEEKEDMTLSEC